MATTITTDNNFPIGLRNRKAWLLHKCVQGQSKVQRVPHGADGNPTNTNPGKFLTYADAVAALPRFDGLTLALTGDGLCCVDLDCCRNPDTGEITPAAQAILNTFGDTYAEVSGSRTGLHLFCYGKLPKNSHKKDSWVELYDHDKAIAVTGWAGGRTEIRNCQEALRALFMRAEAGEFSPTKVRTPAAAEAQHCRDESEEDFRLLAKLQDEIHATNATALANELAKRYPERYAERNRVKGNRAGRTYIEYTATNLLKRLQPSAPAEEQTGSGPNGELIWRDVFHTGAELDSAPGRIFVKGFLEEGISAIGSLSGVGKTWVGLSISHAVITGEPLFGTFPVVERANVLYLVPEMGGRKFRQRMAKMRIPMDGSFYCQTIKDGACDLRNNELLLAAIEDMRPVVILDTAIRFQTGEENSSTDQAQGLGASIMNLIKHGAGAVICMHHRKKDAGNEELSLENALRGSGDFGAIADCVWAVEHARQKKTKAKGGELGNAWDLQYTKESKQLTRLYLECVKPRDMEPADPFVIQGRPYIDEHGDFVVLTTAADERPHVAQDEATTTNSDERGKVVSIIKQDPKISMRVLAGKVGMGHARIKKIAAEADYRQVAVNNRDFEWQYQGVAPEGLPF